MPHLFIIIATPQLNACPSRPACCERFLPLSTQADVAGLSTFQCLESLQKPIHAHSQQQVAVGPISTAPEVHAVSSLLEDDVLRGACGSCACLCA